MKQIIAIIRDEQVEATKTALASAGVKGTTFLYVTGRGEQKGRVSTRELAGSLNRNIRMQLERPLPPDEPPAAMNGRVASHPDAGFAFGFLPKRMLVLVACDEDVNRIIQAIVSSNQTGRHGDGRIFICPLISAVRVRTGEQGNKALI